MVAVKSASNCTGIISKRHDGLATGLHLNLESHEKKAVFALASIFSLRMFGLFMLLPILAIHAMDLADATPFLTGLALGIYGLTQAVFQIPFGMLSDRLDRKKVIAAGLLVFAAGSAIAAMSDSIVWLIIGRAVQGAGAVSAAILALTADLTRSDSRTRAMAVIGVSIGATFILSLVLAPIFQDLFGVDGMFWGTFILSFVAIFILFKVVPDAEIRTGSSDYSAIRSQFARVVRSQGMLQLFVGIFVSHLVLTAIFVVLPGLLVVKSGLVLSDHWKLYVPVLLISVVGMLPFIFAGSRRHWITWSYRAAVLLMFAAVTGLVYAWSMSLTVLLFWVVLFFTGFNALESLLPSLVSRIAPANSRGTAIGIYNTCLFAGVFAGGTLGGHISGRFGFSGVMVLCGCAVFLWVLVAFFSAPFKMSTSRIIDTDGLDISQKYKLVDRIGQLKGIEEVRFHSGGAGILVEVDEESCDTAALQRIIQNMGE